MRGTSGTSLAAASARWEPVLQLVGGDGLRMGEELFAVVAALDGSPQLRRALTDPARSGSDKAALAQEVFAQVDERVVDLMSGLVRSRWASDVDLADAVESLGVDAILAAADSRGALVRVEEELFQTVRALRTSREAREALSDSMVKPHRRQALASALLGGKADPATVLLAQHAALAPRGRRFIASLVWFGDRGAYRRRRVVAAVSSAVMLTAQQSERLSAMLQRAYGQEVQLNVTVDPAVVGGLRIQVGADVVDSTVLSRLADARRRVAS